MLSVRDAYLHVGLGHVVENSTSILSHGNIRKPTHTPIITPLIAYNPVAISATRILASASGIMAVIVPTATFPLITFVIATATAIAVRVP